MVRKREKGLIKRLILLAPFIAVVVATGLAGSAFKSYQRSAGHDGTVSRRRLGEAVQGISAAVSPAGGQDGEEQAPRNADLDLDEKTPTQKVIWVSKSKYLKKQPAAHHRL